jgi:hypothetical protein
MPLLRLIARQPRAQRCLKQALADRPIRDRNPRRPEIKTVLRIPKHQSKQFMLASLLPALRYVLNDLYTLGSERLSGSG